MPDRIYYQRNRSRYISQAKARAEINRAIIDEFKSRPCARCKQTYPTCVMDLHHYDEGKDPTIKAKSVGQMLTYAEFRLREELRKCVPLCANCHRLEHNTKQPEI